MAQRFRHAGFNILFDMRGRKVAFGVSPPQFLALAFMPKVGNRDSRIIDEVGQPLEHWCDYDKTLAGKLNKAGMRKPAGVFEKFSP